MGWPCRRRNPCRLPSELPSLPEPDPGVDQISGRFIAADSTVHFGGVRLHVTAGGRQRNLHHQPPKAFRVDSTITPASLPPSVGWPTTTRPREEKSQHAAPSSPLLFFQPCSSRPRCYKATKQDRRVEHVAVREAPKATIPLWARQSSPAALIPAPLAFHPSSFVVANSSLRIPSWECGSIHCCPATLSACELVGYLPTAVSNKQRPFACRVCNPGPAATATLFLLHGVDNRVNKTDDLRTSSLASSVSRRPSLVTLVPRLSMTGRRGNGYFSHERCDPAQKPRRPAAG